MYTHYKSILLGITLLLSANAAFATILAGTVIDFEDLAGLVEADGSTSLGEGIPVSSGGFIFTPGPVNNTYTDPAGIVGQPNDLHVSNTNPNWAWNDTTILGGHDDIVMTCETGCNFDLVYFDFAGAPTDWEDDLTIRGVRGDGSTVEYIYRWDNYEVDGIVDGPGGAVDFQTYYGIANQEATFADFGFTNLVSLTFEHYQLAVSSPSHLEHFNVQGLFALDDIGVTVVPEPSTWLLFGIGLLGLLVATRKRLS
ncbi:MAG: hypothetical protein BMS9Abin26_0189 [Gammaproteobacteria bacterium]|nr:MAG: hypothetical protein BMS9Abin26_0189 [Gammaproteobacteria bacterium]